MAGKGALSRSRQVTGGARDENHIRGARCPAGVHARSTGFLRGELRPGSLVAARSCAYREWRSLCGIDPMPKGYSRGHKSSGLIEIQLSFF